MKQIETENLIMSKSVMLSIQPKWCELITSGKKTIELRKSKPNLEIPFKCYIYCTKGGHLLTFDNQKVNGKVIGEFICDKIYQYTTTDFKDGTDIDDETITKLSCLTKAEIKSYETDIGYFGVFAWHITDVLIYDNPKDLIQFKRPCKFNHNCNDCELLEIAEIGAEINTKTLTTCVNWVVRPPQSWCYVEEAV